MPPALIAPVVAAALAAEVTSTLVVVISNIISAVLSLAVSMGISAILKPKPNKASISGRRDSMQQSVREPTKPRNLIYGRVKVGGVVVYMESINNESDLLLAVALAGHQVKGIDEVYFFDELAVDQNGVVQPKFKNLVTFEKFLGTDTQTASTILLESNKWSSNHRLLGIAYVVFKLTFNREVFNQVPNVTAVVRGFDQIYDPRTNTSGYTKNAALCLAHYLNHPVYGLSAGYGTDIDNTTLMAAANLCDEEVAIKAGKVLELDGSTSVIDIPDSTTFDITGAALTIEARIYPTNIASASGMNIFDKDEGHTAGAALWVFNNTIRWITRGLSNVIFNSAATITANTWQHVAATWNPATGQKIIYVNGSPVATVSGVTGNLVSTTVSAHIGAGFQGRIQDVRLWSRARTQTEIQFYRDKTLQGDELGLMAYWKLDEKKGTVAEDGTENGNDGVIKNSAWVDEQSVLGTNRRYDTNGVIYSDQIPRDIIEDMLSAMAGSLVPSGGQWLIRAGGFQTPTIFLNENDARDALVIQPRRARRDLFNGVRGTFLAPENDWQPSDFPLVTNTAFQTQDNGEAMIQDIQLPLTSSSSTAQRLAWLHLFYNRRQISCIFKAKLSALQVRAGDTVYLSNARLGWIDKEFEVTNWQFVQIEDEGGNPGLGVDLELRETAAAIFDFNPATDEVPINPSPRTNLPSPFGNIAITSGFIERTGFTEIMHQDATGWWPGRVGGMVRNPLTGNLNPDDLIGAAGDNFDVFDNYVQSAVLKPFYESLEMDIGFLDTVRTFVEFGVARGAGVVNNFGVIVEFAYKLDPLADYTDWLTLPKSAVVDARTFKYRIIFDLTSGNYGYLLAMNSVIDKTTVHQSLPDLIIPIGGKTFEYPKPYHRLPALTYGVKTSQPLTVSFPSVTETDFRALVFNAGSDVGGVVSVIIQGV